MMAEMGRRRKTLLTCGATRRWRNRKADVQRSFRNAWHAPSASVQPVRRRRSGSTPARGAPIAGGSRTDGTLVPSRRRNDQRRPTCGHGRATTVDARARLQLAHAMEPSVRRVDGDGRAQWGGGLPGVPGPRRGVPQHRGPGRAGRHADRAAPRRHQPLTRWTSPAPSPPPSTSCPVVADEARIRSGFADVRGDVRSSAAKALLERSQSQWRSIGDAIAGTDADDLTARGAVVSKEVPEVLSLLDKAGSSGRAAARRPDHRRAPRPRRHGGPGGHARHGGAAGRAAAAAPVIGGPRARRDAARHGQPAGGGRPRRPGRARPSRRAGPVGGQLQRHGRRHRRQPTAASAPASTDPLSGLPNRSALHARLDAVLAQPERRHGGAAVLFVDLDDFKDVNDALGHAAGDELLRIVAQRLVDSVRPGGLVARLGGDESASCWTGSSSRGRRWRWRSASSPRWPPIDIGQHLVHGAPASVWPSAGAL